MKRDYEQLKPQHFKLLCVAIFPLLLLVGVDGKAADPSADYPSKPIEYVTHSSPGGSSDIFTRMVSDIVRDEKILSQPLNVTNKSGTGGAKAMGYLFENKGNPYIIMSLFSSTFASGALLADLPFTTKLFTPIANLLCSGSVLVVRTDSPFKTIDDIIAEARKRPKELIQGGSSITGAASLMGRSIQKMKGVQWNFISFKTNAEALLNVLSKNVDFGFAPASNTLDHVLAGKMRVLLSGSPSRYPEYKDAPTIKEAGLGDPVIVNYGIAGPPNMPEYAVKKLEAAFKNVSDSNRFKKFMKEDLMQDAWIPAVEYGKFLEEEYDRCQVLLMELDLLKKK